MEHSGASISPYSKTAVVVVVAACANLGDFFRKLDHKKSLALPHCVCTVIGHGPGYSTLNMTEYKPNHIRGVLAGNCPLKGPILTLYRNTTTVNYEFPNPEP